VVVVVFMTNVVIHIMY